MTKLLAFAALTAFLGCGGDKPPAKDPTAIQVGTKVEPAVTPPTPVADDPWGKEPPKDPTEPPDVTETKALADKACPIVKAPYYWKFTKANKTSYLLGSRHLGVPLAKMPPKVKEQILKSSQVIFETPPGDDSDDPPGDGSSLADKLGPKLWEKYERLVGKKVAANVEHGKPSVAILMLMMMYEDKTSALDMEIEQLASESGLKTGGLESSAFQTKLLEELLDVRMLKATIEGTPDRKTMEKDSFDDLAEYCAGTDESPGMDAHAIKQMKDAGYTDAEIKRLDERMLDERNLKWIPQLDKLFTAGNVFVVVGADHLSGPKGVVKLMQAKGFKAERVAP